MSHTQKSCAPSQQDSRRESLAECASAAEEQARLEAAVAEKEKEVEKLKFEMIETASKLEEERRERREAVVQATDRLQQLVAMQTQIGLERQAMNDDLMRLREYERERAELGRKAKMAEKEMREAEARVAAEAAGRARAQEELETKKSEVLVQKDLNEALTAALQKKTVEAENLAREARAAREESGERERETTALEQKNQEAAAEINRLEAKVKELKETERTLRAEAATLRAAAEEKARRESVLQSEIAGFVGFGRGYEE